MLAQLAGPLPAPPMLPASSQEGAFANKGSFEGEDDKVTKREVISHATVYAAHLQPTCSTWSEQQGNSTQGAGTARAPTSLSPGGERQQATWVAGRGPHPEDECVLGRGRGGARSLRCMVSAPARVASERQELQGHKGRGSCVLPTHLVEAVMAGQCRFAERKVSHCGRQERRGVSLGRGAAPEPRAEPITLCGRPWWSGHQWPWWALASHVLSCQLPQVSWLIHRSSSSIEKPTPP